MSKQKPKAVIYDVDKTLTKKNVAKNARKDAKKGKKVLVVTSRPETQRKDTEQFLKENKIPADKVLMRPKNNGKKDSKVKNLFTRKTSRANTMWRKPTMTSTLMLKCSAKRA